MNNFDRGSRICYQTMKHFVFSAIQSTFLLGLISTSATASTLKIQPIGSYSTGIFDDEAAFISAFDPFSSNLFVTNRSAQSIDILSLSNPTNPFLVGQIKIPDLNPDLFGNVLHVRSFSYDTQSLFAVSVENVNRQDNGSLLFFNADGSLFNGSVENSSVMAGPLPDMFSFTPDGTKLLVANEGEPNDEYTIDPEGSVSLIDLENLFAGLAPTETKIGLTDFNVGGSKADKLTGEGIRIFGPNATVAQDLEPEYITVSADGKKAWVTFQENNAIGLLDLETQEFTEIVGLGFKDHRLPGNALDPSDRDGGINIKNWPVFGMYQPDEAAAYTAKGKTYIVIANEGSGRAFDDGYSEEVRVEDLTLDPDAFPADIQDRDKLGRLTVTNQLGDTDGDGDFDELYVFGGRSFSILDENGKMIFDSGDQFEQITAKLFPEYFNADNSENNFDNRSDNKGPEPEGVTIGELFGRTYAFIGLERIGGIMTYDITDPLNPFFVSYDNNRDFSVEFDENEEGDPDPTDEQLAAVGDLGPEGLLFIDAKNSPNGKTLLISTNEVSGTTTIYSVERVPEPGTILGLLAASGLGSLMVKRKR
ncbi:choice-of-anchor I family protein [Limnoraphis robusta]|uniref:Choice-of-anchor I family protein n=1 Tax=Limnoraphis robusta CCNP1315 TaxID=3110306 RepID=A0ABU5TSE4_9CYAN|nr:choice-of-anchor I family protein [Limnoraphis robusta]MEA5517632.1 choice-of-anchor I family protein [Limnoraphis robusta CCNP1315]MEA5544354.1 choice-of-anchor I family protein [Limnoraphis robusta CCNP1324]